MEPDGTIVELNRKEAGWRAPNARDGVGRKVWDAPTFELYPEHKPLIKRAVKQAAAGKIFNQEVRLERDGAPTAHLDVSVQPVARARRQGALSAVRSARRDRTQEPRRSSLRQSQKMEALGQLTGGIAHDFNNLLTVVVGGLDLLVKRTEDAKLKRYAENALAAAERGARLTGQLLAFSRVQRLEVRPTHVAPLIENMRPLLRNVLGPGHREALRPRRGDDAGDGRPDPARGRGPQPRDQRPRRHARRRHPELLEPPADGPRRPRNRRRRLYRADHHRHRHRHAARGRRARVRAVLHHQGSRQGHRPWPVDGLWHGAPIGRRAPGSKAATAKAPRSSSCSARPTSPSPRPPSRPRRPAAPARPAGRRCRCW